ncbi:hypothetical protein BC941DRAFT_222159 [Chlamydoabsidia padenii]|nr:hypothetical protein BC941DRAFT_222159 [Chlamydoabsidia padenii]
MADTDLCSYVNWINENGGSFSKIQLVKDTDGNGRSVFATETIQTDDAFATIPFKLAISEPVARQAFPGLERFSCRIVMSLFVAHQKAIDSSFYAPYLNILPTDIKTPFFFDNNDMKYLENTNLALGVKERYQKLQQDFADLMADASVSDQVKASVTWDQFLWAHCAISSRSFPYKLIDPAYSNPSSEVLFPLVDSLNHRPNTKITWSRSGDAETGSLTFVAGQSFPAGEQVFNNYGPKSNEERRLDIFSL